MLRPSTLLAMTVAYVLGARAGRAHFDPLARAVRKAWDGGPVAERPTNDASGEPDVSAAG